VCVCVCVQ